MPPCREQNDTFNFADPRHSSSLGDEQQRIFRSTLSCLALSHAPPSQGAFRFDGASREKTASERLNHMLNRAQTMYEECLLDFRNHPFSERRNNDFMARSRNIVPRRI